jgi:hypothetical protein
MIAVAMPTPPYLTPQLTRRTRRTFPPPRLYGITVGNPTFSDRQLSFDTPHALIWLVLGVAVVAWLLITTP